MGTNFAERPLTPTLQERASLVSTPHPPSPEGGLRRTRERGEEVSYFAATAGVVAFAGRLDSSACKVAIVD